MLERSREGVWLDAESWKYFENTVASEEHVQT